MAKHFLGVIQSAQLVNYIQNNYAEFGLSDKEFAAKATEELGFQCTFNNVYDRRTLLGIPATAKVRVIKEITDIEPLRHYAAELEKRIITLEFEVAALKNRPFDYKK